MRDYQTNPFQISKSSTSSALTTQALGGWYAQAQRRHDRAARSARLAEMRLEQREVPQVDVVIPVNVRVMVRQARVARVQRAGRAGVGHAQGEPVIVGQIDVVIPVDGKTARRSHDGKHGLGPLHLVSAWATENGLSLGQVATDEKSNEITANTRPAKRATGARTSAITCWRNCRRTFP